MTYPLKMSFEHLFLFGAVSFFYIISPGPAVFLAISNGMKPGTKSLALSSAGNIVGLLFLSNVSILGLGTLIITSSKLFFMVKLVGAVYLIFLGIKQIRLKVTYIDDEKIIDSAHQRLFSYFSEGLFLAITNPKAIIFFTALFPQFLDLESAVLPQFIAMTAIFMTISFTVLFSYGSISKLAKGLLASEQRMRWFNRVTGGLFIGIGLGLLHL